MTNSYPGGTTVSGGVLNFAPSQTLTSLAIGEGAVVTLANAAPAPDFPERVAANIGGSGPGVAAESDGVSSTEGGNLAGH